MRILLGRKKSPHRDLEKAIGYGFTKTALLVSALTHRSYRFEHRDVTDDNQRLEFLGDAVLAFAAAAHLYEEMKETDEGVLTSIRSQMTSGRSLSQIAREIDMGRFLRMGKGEELSGGRDRASNLEDALEAVLGAAYLDGGSKAVRKIFKTLFVPRIERLSGDVFEDNPKGRLQEYAQRHWRRSPQYRIAERKGPPHAMIFTAEVVLDGEVRGRGEGLNKQQAEAAAAMSALQKYVKDFRK
jgi:ribonuclease-3